MKGSQQVYRISFGSAPKNIVRIERFLKKVNHAVHLDEIQMHKLMVSLTEAVNNAIVHGNRSDEEKKVAVVCEILPGWLLFLVNDEGAGFSAEKIKNPLSKRNMMKENGRGIFLMRTLMDKVEFESTKKGMQVRLWLDIGKR